MANNSTDFIIRDAIKKLLNKIATRYNIDYEELLDTLSKPPETCLHTFLSGKNRGTRCQKQPLDNGFCGQHLNTAFRLENKRRIKKESGPSAAQIKTMEEWSTALPREPTVLKPCKYGYIDEYTEILFNENYVVIGKMDHHGKKILLTGEDVKVCETHAWEYPLEIIDDTPLEESE